MIKNPTYRKVVNRGFTPILYRTKFGCYFCWIEKVGTKLLHVRFTDNRRRRVPKSEVRYMSLLTDKHGTTGTMPDEFRPKPKGVKK